MMQKVKNMGYAKSVSLLVWLFAAVAVVAFSSLLIYMNQYEKGQLTENKTINIKELLKDAEKLRIGESDHQHNGLHKDQAKEKGKPHNQNQAEQQTAQNQNQVAKPNLKKDETSRKDSSSDTKKTTFDFYSLLPEMEVMVPDTEIKLRSGVTKPNHTATSTDTKTDGAKTDGTNAYGTRKSAPTTSSNTVAKSADPLRLHESYFIQAGAFKDIKSADRRKANLALIGIKSSIVSVNLKSRGIWHRVRVGPFVNVDQMSRVRSVMKSNNIATITVKVKS